MLLCPHFHSSIRTHTHTSALTYAHTQKKKIPKKERKTYMIYHDLLFTRDVRTISADKTQKEVLYWRNSKTVGSNCSLSTFFFAFYLFFNYIPILFVFFFLSFIFFHYFFFLSQSKVLILLLKFLKLISRCLNFT